MTTTDPFIEAARAEAELRVPMATGKKRYDGTAEGVAQEMFEQGAEWARTHLAAQEPTDAEVLAALNASMDPHGPPEPHLGRYAPRDVDEMRRAIAAARAARRNEEKQ